MRKLKIIGGLSLHGKDIYESDGEEVEKVC